MKKIFSILVLLTAPSLFAQQPQEVCQNPESQTAEQTAEWIDPCFIDAYEDSDVDSEEPEPIVSWPGRNRDPFYDQVTR